VLVSPITTHVLDTAAGRPAAGIPVTLERQRGNEFVAVGSGTTDRDGRVANLLPPGRLEAGTYRITFLVEDYFAAAGRGGFYPSVTVVFVARAADEHYHVPLLLAPYGYSTYRGS
jgi:5-hydroxyisourate hydrolase